MEREADGTITIRPDRRRVPRWGSLAALPLALIGVVRLLLLGWTGVVILAVTVGMAVGLGFLVRSLFVGHSYARLTPSTLTVKPWYWYPRSVPRESVSRVALVRVDFGRYSSQADQLRLLFLGGDNRCLLALNCLGIAPSDAATFATELHVPFNDGMERMRPAVLRRGYPGSISSFYAHQVAYGLGIAFVIVGLVVGGVIGWAAVTGQLAAAKPVALGVTQAALGSSRRHVADVTVVAVDDPASVAVPASAAMPGTHFTGIRVRVRDTGSAPVLSPSIGLIVRDSHGHAWFVDSLMDPAVQALNTDADVEPGASETVYVVIRVPDGTTLTRVEYNPGTVDLYRLTWIVPPRPPAPTPPPLPLGRTISLDGENVSVLAVDDTGRGARTPRALAAGDHLVGVQVRIQNGSTSAQASPDTALSVVDSGGERNDDVDLPATSDTAIASVPPGQTVTVTVYFDVPNGARITEVDYSYVPPGVGVETPVAWSAS